MQRPCIYVGVSALLHTNIWQKHPGKALLGGVSFTKQKLCKILFFILFLWPPWWIVFFSLWCHLEVFQKHDMTKDFVQSWQMKVFSSGVVLEPFKTRCLTKVQTQILDHAVPHNRSKTNSRSKSYTSAEHLICSPPSVAPGHKQHCHFSRPIKSHWHSRTGERVTLRLISCKMQWHYTVDLPRSAQAPCHQELWGMWTAPYM